MALERRESCEAKARPPYPILSILKKKKENKLKLRVLNPGSGGAKHMQPHRRDSLSKTKYIHTHKKKLASYRRHPRATDNTDCRMKSSRRPASRKKIVCVLPRTVHKRRVQLQHIEHRSASSHESSKSHCIKKEEKKKRNSLLPPFPLIRP